MSRSIFMTTDLNSQKNIREEGGWKRIAHQRQWHAQSACRSKHARQHCSPFSTEFRNITWKMYVPGKGITPSSETWGTCLQGSDGRELVADSPLGFLSELKFYFTFPTLHGSAWSANLARTELQLCLQFSPCFLSCGINHCFISGKWKPDIGKSGQSSNNTPVLASARHRTFCVLTCTRIWSSRAGDWRWLLPITTLKVFLGPVFFLSPRSDTQKIRGISRT